MKDWLKNCLRKWLEVPEIPNVLTKEDLVMFVTKDYVKKMIEDAVYEAIVPNFKNGRVRLFFLERYTELRGCLKQHMNDIFKGQASEKVEIEIKKQLDPEEFIDKVVERIRKKQI